MNNIHSQLSSRNEETMNIFLVGNNPAEIEEIYNKLRSINKYHFHTYISFDLNKIFRRIRKLQPLNILLDDRLNRKELNRLLFRLHHSPWTRDIPVILLKSSNREVNLEEEADEYMLKESISEENLYRSIINSRRYRKASIYFRRTYSRTRGILEFLKRLFYLDF